MPDLVTAGCVIVGTGLGFAQVPNKKSQKLADSDLAVFSLAFLAIAALVPSLTPSSAMPATASLRL